MSMVKTATYKWPPQCCVPAFVNAALMQHGIDCPHPKTLPSLLGVHVRPDQENPLRLPIATPQSPPGLRPNDADFSINRLFRELDLTLRFRRVGFHEVYGELWEEVLDHALRAEAVVGLGVDYRVLVGRETAYSAQHIFRVTGQEGKSLQLYDDSGETSPASFAIDWELACKAVLSVSDGFWLIGNEETLQNPHTLPWSTDG